MKILYSAGNYNGANIFLSRFLENISNHDVKILAYYKNHNYLHHIDWTTDSLHSGNKFQQWQIKHLFETDDSLPCLNPNKAVLLYNELLDWQPDLIISDVEPISAFLAHSLKIELWYCSPLLLLTGIEWETTRSLLFEKVTNKIKQLPQASKKLVCSPFCDIMGRPILKDGFEWVKPYYKKLIPAGFDLLNKIVDRPYLSTRGETSFFSDILYNNTYTVFCPEDKEQMLNATLAETYGVGTNIGRLIDFNLAKTQVDRMIITDGFLSEQNWPTLDTLIKEKYEKNSSI